MKKYIYMMLVVLTAGFASCSNDDIPMEEDVTMKTFDVTFVIDPSDVVEGYKFEWDAGELQVVPDDAQLRLRILIYDSNGEIVDLLTHKQSNYQSTWSIKTELEAGTYTALVISDVINTNNPDVEEYWTLENYEKIKDARLSKNQKWLGYQKEILGMNSMLFSVENSNTSISINVNPIGAACYLLIRNLEAYSGIINGYDLVTNHNVTYAFWDSSFELKIEKDIASNNGDDVWDRFNTSVGGCINLKDYEFGEGTGYNFHAFFYLLPSQKQNFAFVADEELEMGSEMFLSEIKNGEQYVFYCELGFQYDGFASNRCYDVTGRTFDEWYEEWYREWIGFIPMGKTVYHEMSKPMFMQKMNNSVYIKDLIKK